MIVTEKITVVVVPVSVYAGGIYRSHTDIQTVETEATYELDIGEAGR